MNFDDALLKDPLEADHRERSNFVQRIVQSTRLLAGIPAGHMGIPPRRIVQFWDDVDQLPVDVRECIQTWKQLENKDFDLILYTKESATDFIRSNLGPRYESAFEKCYHPAMQSDYFRLCYILLKGGCYVDCDDIYCGTNIDHLFRDGRLKLQPLCYDIGSGEMIPPRVFTNPGANSLSWIFYFNNNPMIAAQDHPILYLALESATTSIEATLGDELPEIQSTTGPGNLTKSIFDAVVANPILNDTFLTLTEWEDIGITRWPLGYRTDLRNWRLSNKRAFRHKGNQGVE